MLRSIQLLFIGMVCHFVCEAQRSSAFDADADGWTFVNAYSGIVSPIVHSPTGGNPDGYISFTYTATQSSTQSWVAPSKFYGSWVVKSYGMNLKFSLQQSHTGTASFSNGEVRLLGNGITLVYSLPTKPTQSPAWSSYNVKLDETGGWRINTLTGAVATRAQMISALSNVTGLEIRATYISSLTASYTSGLDEVMVEEKTLTTAPAISSIGPTSGKVGDVITITGTDFDPSPSANAVYFDGVSASISSASLTELVVKVPKGAPYGEITVVNKTTGLQKKSRQAFTPTFDGGGRIIPASFFPKFDINLSVGIEGFDIGDLDGDGWVDLAVSNNESDAVDIYRNLGLGGDLTTASFAPRFTITMTGSSTNGAGLRIADMDGDGKLDVVSSTGTSAFNSAFATFRNVSTPGNLAFEAQENWAGLTDETPVHFVGDLDGDGRPELIGGEGSGGGGANLWIAQNISSPGNIDFAGSLAFFSATVDALNAVSAADLDNDGKPELLVNHAFGGTFSIIKNNSTPGNLSFTDIGQVTGGTFYALQAADFDGDGKNDIVYKRGADDIHIRLNTNDGVSALATTDFTSDIILASDLGSYGGMSIGDINGDGRPDIVATDDGDVGVFENVHAGGPLTANSFIPAYLFQGAGNSTYPTSPVAADLNGDGKPELVMGVTNTSPDRITIFQNKNVIAPKISLTTVSPLAGPVGSRVTITGGHFSTTPSNNLVKFGGVQADVITATETSLVVEVPKGNAYGAVSVTRDELTAQYHLPFDVLFSPGATLSASSFGAPVNFALPTADFDIDAADLDGDNKIDVIAEGATQLTYLFRNVHSSGSITTSSLVSQGNTSSAANPRLVDIDGDGKPDITSVQGTLRNTSTLGTISFDATVNVAATTNIGYADFNLDGRVDVIGISGTLIEVHENRATTGAFTTGTFGTLSTPFNLAAGGTAVASAVADFDNDGFKDIVATVNTTGVDNIVVFKNNGAYRLAVSDFTNSGTFATLDLPGRIYEGDLDVDGKMDLVVYQQAAGTSGNFWSVFHNTSSPGSISFTRIDYQLGTLSGTTGTVGGPSTISDLDGDGKPEVIITSGSTTAARQGFYIFKNTSTPGTIDATSFTSSGLITLSGARAVAAADLNLDHRPELIFTRTGSLLSVMENLLTPTTISFTTQPATVTLCDVMDADLTATATGDNNLQYRWQKLNALTGQYEDVPDDATYEGINSQLLEISYPPLVDTYRVVVQGDYSLGISTPATLTVSSTPSAPGGAGDIQCTGSTATLSASGGSNGNYRWYTVASGGSSIPAETNSDYITPTLTATTSFFVALNSYGCESPRTELIATINVVNPPSVTDGSRCDAGTVMLTSAGAVNGQYRWYETITGATLIPAEVNSAFTTPSLSSTTSYFVAIHDGTCESSRTEVIANVNTTPSSPTAVNGARCDIGSINIGATGGSNGNYRWYLSASGGSALAGEVNSSYSTPSLSSTTSFFVSHVAGNCESLRTEVVASIGSLSSPSVNSPNVCSGSNAVLSAAGGTNGQYRWYTSASGGTSISGENNSLFTTPVLTSTTSYFVSITDGTCESARAEAVSTVTTIVPPLTTGGGARCGSGTVTLSASGGTNGNYRWYDVASGGTPFSGEINNSFTTPSLSATTPYYVSLSDGTCESTRVAVAATIHSPPSKPSIQSSVAPIANMITLCNGSVNLSAPAGFSYLWSNGATTQQVSVSTAGTFSVQVIDGNACMSVASDPVVVFINPDACNTAPVVAAGALTTSISGNVSLTISEIVTDAENNFDTIVIVTPPISGATVTIVNGILRIDYSTTTFSGTDQLVIRACDVQKLCSENVTITIEVIGEIEIFNAVSPNGDGLNEYLRLQYIEVLERTRNNTVTILNRWGDKVFEVANYDNDGRAFKGLNNHGVELPSGTYFYKIEFTGPNAPPTKTGYFALKR